MVFNFGVIVLATLAAISNFADNVDVAMVDSVLLNNFATNIFFAAIAAASDSADDICTVSVCNIAGNVNFVTVADVPFSNLTSVRSTSVSLAIVGSVAVSAFSTRIFFATRCV